MNDKLYGKIPKKKILKNNYLLDKLVEVAISLSAQKDPDNLFNIIIDESMKITNCDGASVYIVEKKEGKEYLRFRIAKNYSRNFPFKEFTLPINNESIAGSCALNGAIYNFKSVDEIPDILGIKYNDSFDKINNYKTINMLVIPMKNLNGETIGVVQLLNKKISYCKKLMNKEDFNKYTAPFTFSKEEENIMSSLASQASILLERNKLYMSIKNLFKSFTESMVATIDQRDPTTAGHSMRVAEYAVNFAQSINKVDYGKYNKEFFNEKEITEIYYAGLLHDIGKIGVKEDILLKKNKLSEEQLKTLKYKFAYVKKSLELKNMKETINENELNLISKIKNYYNSICKINNKNFVTEEEINILKEIKKNKFKDEDGEIKELISDVEYENLSVRKGNLTREQRDIMSTHPLYTYKILNSISWGEDLKNVPFIAACHHEKINGSGYPWGLDEKIIPLKSKMLAIIDIYDALTAKDRPYKPPLPVEVALKILKEEAQNNNVDGDLLKIFIKEQVYILEK